MQYQTEVKAEQALIRDGVRKMMHLAAFQHFSSKPKNYPPRGLSPKEAEVEFNRLHDEPDAIIDYLGPNPEFRTQVAIVTDTLVINRNSLTKTQGYTLTDKAISATPRPIALGGIRLACSPSHHWEIGFVSFGFS